MKRYILACAIAILITPAFAVTAVLTPPTLPSDLETAWVKVSDKSCVREDKVVITLKVYDRDDDTSSHRLYVMTKNDEIVNQLESILGIFTGKPISANGYVKKVDGTWAPYDWRSVTERVKGDRAIANIVGMTGPEFMSCVRTQNSR